MSKSEKAKELFTKGYIRSQGKGGHRSWFYCGG